MTWRLGVDLPAPRSDCGGRSPDNLPPKIPPASNIQRRVCDRGQGRHLCEVVPDGCREELLDTLVDGDRSTIVGCDERIEVFPIRGGVELRDTLADDDWLNIVGRDERCGLKPKETNTLKINSPPE
jgi:hypothetical protein